MVEELAMLLIGLSLATATPLQQAAAPVPAPATTPAMCRVAANKVAVFVLLGRAMIKRLDARGVQGAEKARRDQLVKSLDENEARVLKIDARYPDLKPGEAENAAFDAMKSDEQQALLVACAGGA